MSCSGCSATSGSRLFISIRIGASVCHDRAVSVVPRGARMSVMSDPSAVALPASMRAPDRTSSVAASMSGARNRSGPGPSTFSRRTAMAAPVRGGRLERCPQLDAARRGHDLDREHPGQARRRRAAACARTTSPSTRGPPASRWTGSSRRSPAPPAA